MKPPRHDGDHSGRGDRRGVGPLTRLRRWFIARTDPVDTTDLREEFRA